MCDPNAGWLHKKKVFFPPFNPTKTGSVRLCIVRGYILRPQTVAFLAKLVFFPQKIWKFTKKVNNSYY